ncbi:hypothetical protein GY45DRAFT_1317339 [Cubamyces sp. BRFM 1775]|nr:hypothetical protein GY45DRAFT_1317339 [Cubamyces sp. BRFM 1775]
MFAPFMQAVTSLVLAFAASAVLAKPVRLTTRDDVMPPITNPTAQTVWRVGETQTVTWDVAALNGAPPSNPTAEIILGTLTPDGDEHLMLESPLASDFLILGGNVSLTVPSVPDGNNYIVCLFGSTGDISPMFTIIGTSNSSTSAPSSALSASTATSASGSASSSPSFASHANTPPASQSATSNTAATSPAASSTPTAPASTPSNPSSSFSNSVGSGNIAAGNATASITSNSSLPSQTPGTSAAELGPQIHAHFWGIYCALVFALTLF